MSPRTPRRNAKTRRRTDAITENRRSDLPVFAAGSAACGGHHRPCRPRQQRKRRRQAHAPYAPADVRCQLPVVFLLAGAGGQQSGHRIPSTEHRIHGAPPRPRLPKPWAVYHKKFSFPGEQCSTENFCILHNENGRFAQKRPRPPARFFRRRPGNLPPPAARSPRRPTSTYCVTWESNIHTDEDKAYLLFFSFLVIYNLIN